MHDVSYRKINLNEDMIKRDIHCLFDVLTIDNADVTNFLIDMVSIESVLLVRSDADARHLMADESRVPTNCWKAYTKEGFNYYPDPNYKSYHNRLNRPRYLQVSVEENIR